MTSWISIHERYSLTDVINAAGTYTPLGVSRSSVVVAGSVAQALSEFFVMDELQDIASETIARTTGAEAGAITHCVAAGITLSIAATMAGAAPDNVARLPDTRGMRHRVVLPAGHAVDYGHSILQDVRLCGGLPIIVGTESLCTLDELDRELSHPGTACLLLVSSRLVRGRMPDLDESVAIAHSKGIPVVLDGAAQDMRIEELLDTGADLILVSGHKYLAGPTAGLIVGRKDLVMAARAHEKGIGRAMKATKEAIVGALAAIEERQKLDLTNWRRSQDEKVADFVRHAGSIRGVYATASPDPAGMPFSRAHLRFEPSQCGKSAKTVAEELKAGTPAIWAMEHELPLGTLIFELVPLEYEEVSQIVFRLEEIVGSR